MRKIKTIFLLLISVLLLTGCNSETFQYSGDETFYELESSSSDILNIEGGKVIVGKGQAFIEVEENTKDYETYLKGEHKISKKEKIYRYYFINMDEVKGNKFGTEEPMMMTDATYGELWLNLFGEFDYKISNVKNFTSAYLKHYSIESIEIEDFVKSKVLSTIIDEILKLNVSYDILPTYAETIEENVVKSLEDSGITCINLSIHNIGLTDISKSKVKAVTYNNIMLETFIQNTTWVATDDSEILFDKERFNWYLNQKDHSDNFQYGNYVFYCGDLAVDYITVDLKSFGVTKSELDNLFASNEKYNAENFVVFNIKLEGYTINETNTVLNKDIYWYGFLLNNNQTLQVVNMTTATYYNFSKKAA